MNRAIAEDAEARFQQAAANVRRLARVNLQEQVIPWLGITDIEVQDAGVTPQHEEAHQLLGEARRLVEQALELLNE